ncbi:hypothetical protein Asppvi_009951 [Aspergillus pseudoviridinutans]|uniref:Uncharacterized protein n=1 Tax=Aspergillus pseudoviridinutans TaxID=1517512 RepID=A0A9P3EWM5_9EURO|nr:uncharacterized protein Asppvi_009951 [Aspergillus pseudoviridinutans]GIJ90986.1 hypothetical protein Asppvi_009951 [Aspergillus pseudoviridinutans]
MALVKKALNLPPFQSNEKGYLEIFLGEVFCRHPGCIKEGRFLSLNNLKKHVQTAHKGKYNIYATEGGAPNHDEQAAAINFYNTLYEEYVATLKQDAPDLPALPKRKDGKVHATNMKKMVKEMGGVVPCSACKDKKKPRGCCSEAARTFCDNFDLFDEDGEEEESDDEEEEETDEEA